MEIQKKIQVLVSSKFSLPIAVLVVGGLAYAIHIPWMGFYWDDWPWVWFSHVMGPEGMLKIDIEHRPLSGLVLTLGSVLSGENPLGWQLYNWVFRVAGCLVLVWMLRVIWPRNPKQVSWIAILFLVYPGFTQQFVAVNSSRHLFPLVTFFLSLGLMVKANKSQKRYGWLTGGALFFSLFTMLTTEYYYGLELIRPLLLWLVNRYPGKRLGERLRKVIQAWLPFLLLLLGVFTWRFAISQNVNYQITFFQSADPASGQGLCERVWAYFHDVAAAGFVAWEKLVQFPDSATFGVRSRSYYWILTVLVAVASALYFLIQSREQTTKSWGIEAMILGAGMLFVGPLPSWLAGLDLKLSFPFDRLTLPLMLGSCLFLVGILDTVVRWVQVKAVLIALLVGFSTGCHFQNALAFRWDWQHQTGFIQQLVWRIPGLELGTAVIANELPTTFSTDNSLTAPLNWTFAPDFKGGDLPYYLFYSGLRFSAEDFELDTTLLTRDDYRFFPFEGDSGEVLVVFNSPPACLRVLSFDLHQDYPNLPEDIRAVLPYADFSQINPTVETSPTLSPPFAGQVQEGSWCYYFESADLARQREDWELLTGFAEKAFQVGFPDSPAKHVAEYDVFIEGFAHTGHWDKSRELTLDAFSIDKDIAPFLCSTWSRSMADTEPSPERMDAYGAISKKLDCTVE